MNLAVFSIEPEKARENYRRTVVDGVKVSEIVKFDSAIKDIIGKTPVDSVGVWGVSYGPMNHSFFEKLRPNDVAVFFDGKNLTNMAKISGTKRNPALGESLWGKDPKTGDSFELICFLSENVELGLPFASFAAAMGYDKDFKPIGFQVFDSQKVESLLANSKESSLWSAILRLASSTRTGLRSLDLKLRYRSGEDDLVNDFYIPCFEQCVTYDRAAGYFSAQTLNLAARGVAGLVRNDGAMRLVVDPLLSAEDVEQIKRGYEQRLDEVLVERLKETLLNADAETMKRVESLAWLIATGKLEIKVAFPTGEGSLPLPYPYHEKWGIFVDSNGDRVVFTGSMNETPAGLKDNFEAIDVYANWRGEDSRERIALKERDFERLWRNNTHGLRVLDFPEAAKKELLKYRPPKAPVVDPSFREPRCPACLELVDRSSFRKGIPVCPKCHTFLPVSLVGFSHYLIEGCRAQLRSGEETVNGRVVKADYSGPSFHFRTDNGREMDVTGEIQRTAFKNGRKVLANGKPAVVMSYVISEKDGRLTYSVLLEGEERFIPEQGVEPAPASIEEQILSQTFEDSQRWTLYVMASIIESAPFMRNGEALLTASSKVKPYEHQLTIAGRIVDALQPRFLLADEVGLGKTIEVGLAIKELQMRGLLNRILIVAPKLLVNQWIGELERRFNIYCKEITSSDFADATWRGRNPFDETEVAITSYQLIQRDQRRQILLESRPWDLVVIDEAHHIRRDPLRGEKNELFKLVDGWETENERQEGLREKCDGLLLVTATPLQLRVQELYDLLNILGLGGNWSVQQFFEKFFDQVVIRNAQVLPYRIAMARDFLSWGNYERQTIEQEIARTGPYGGSIEEILFSGRDPSVREQNDDEFLQHLHRILTLCTPLRWVMFRNTREVLRRYGLKVPKRIPRDHLFPLARSGEEEIYNSLSDYIRYFYEKSRRENRKALGFVMATYRKRLTSSFHAIKRSLEKRLDYLTQVGAGETGTLLAELTLPEEQDDDEFYTDEERQTAYLEDRSFNTDIEEEIQYVKKLLAVLNALNSDTKLTRLHEILESLFRKGVDKVIIFTQYYDTLDYLRRSLSETYQGNVVCYSGRGGEVWEGSRWKSVPTDDAVSVFQQSASIMISTEAGSEGKNFQFCNVIVNFDLPWNPMRVEQRIGRVDRIGQRSDVEIHNMFFENTIDGEVYSRLRKRIRLFETVVGPLHPILEKIERYALEYPREEALVKIGEELRGIDVEHDKAVEIEERAQEFLFSGFDKSILASFDVNPPIVSEDIRRFVKLAAANSNGEVALQDSNVPGLYVLTVGESISSEIRRRVGYTIRAKAPVIFSPAVAEELATADPRSQEARLIANGSPILEVLLDKWKRDSVSKVTILQAPDSTDTSLVFLYRARFSGLLRREEFVPILVDLKTLEAHEMTLELFLQQFTAVQHALEASTVVENVDIKLESVMKASSELWGKLFDSLNAEWANSDESEYHRRKKLLESALNRIFSKAKAAIDVQLRRLVTLRYIQDYPNTDRLPDGEIDLSSIAGAIENSPELSDIFPLVQIDPSDIRVRGKEVKETARSFRTVKQRQALHLQLRSAIQTITNEYSQYRKTSEKIKSLLAELEKDRGAQATYSLFCALMLSTP